MEYIVGAAIIGIGLYVVYKMLFKKETVVEAVQEVAKEAVAEVKKEAEVVVAKVEEKAAVVVAKVEETVTKAADLNGDGKVDMADAMVAVKKTTAATTTAAKKVAGKAKAAVKNNRGRK